MKILYVSAIELDVPGGPRTHILEMVKAWHSSGHDIYLLTPRFNQKRLNLPFKVAIYPFFGYSFFRRLLSYLILSIILLRCISQFRPDVLYERQMEFNPFIWLVGRMCTLPFFVEINGLMAEDLRHTGSGLVSIFIHRIIERKEFRASAGMCCTSSILKKKISERYKNIADKLCYIPNGVNLNLFRSLDKKECREKLGFSPELKYIGYIGTFNHLHDSEQAMKSFKEVGEKITDLRMIMAGDGPRRKSCQNLAADQGLTGKVIFAGSIRYEDVPAMISCFDLGLVLASEARLEREGVVAFKLFEFLACGCPTIANYLDKTDFDRFSPFVRMVHFRDKQAIANGIVELLQDSAISSLLAKRALVYVQKNISWEKSAAKTAEFIEQRIRKI